MATNTRKELSRLHASNLFLRLCKSSFREHRKCKIANVLQSFMVDRHEPLIKITIQTRMINYSLSHEFVVILMSGLWRSYHETLQYISKFYLRCSQKLLLQSLSNVLDACKRGSSFLVFLVARFLLRICLKVKADYFFLAE